MLSIFLCACWPSIVLLWGNVYLGLLPIFELSFVVVVVGVVVVVVELCELFVYGGN